ncbi:MAG: NADH-quinone oxidoreductase subunit N [Myxococcota bacterium]
MTADLFLGLSPLLLVAVGALVLMLVEALSKLRDDHVESPSASLAAASAVVLFSASVASIGVWLYGPENLPVLQSLAPYLLIDRFSLFFFVILTLGGGLSCLLAGGYLPEHKLDRGEFYPLLLLATVGAMALAAAADLLTIFVGLEAMSLGVYAMIAFRRGSPRAVEAALKYFLLGSFAAALLLYGGALLYGATGHTDLAGIGAQLAKTGVRFPQAGSETPQDMLLLAYDNAVPLVIVGLILMLVGLAFKVSAVPFHMWTPDAYEGAPTPATTYMAVAVKAAAFAMMLRVLMIAFSDPRSASWGSGWPPVLATLAVATMTIANVIAGRQASVKRMLAYSSIAHAGYLLLAMVAASKDAERAEASIIFYLLVYTVSTVGAFGALIWCGSRGAEAVSYDDLAGLGKRHPAVAFAFSLFLLSLAGIPPLAGFFGKLYLFQVTIESGFVLLAVLGLINSVVAAYYYLRVLVYMYMREPEPGAPIAKPMTSGYVAAALLISAVLVVVLGLLPSGTLDAAVLAGR